MDRQTVFTKTAKGMMEATGKTSALSRDMRALLKEIDGKATLGEVHARLGKLTEAKLQEALQVLARSDYIREFKPSRAVAPPPRPSEPEIDLDFTTAIPTISTLAKKAEEEAREKAKAAAAAKAKIETEAKAKAAAAAAQARAEAERKAKEVAERARREAEERARREAEERARRDAEEAERKAREEAERKAREEADRKAREEAAERERRQAEERARKEAEEAERKAKEAAERERQEAEERARREAEEQARREAEEAERKAKEAAERERQEAEERARREAEERARREAEEAERKAKEAAEREQQEAEERARREAEERARREAEEAERKAKEAAERERQEAEERARREAEEAARESAQQPPVPVESSSSLDDMVKIETDFDAVLDASEGAALDEAKRSSGADDALQKEAEEQARRHAAEEERAKEERAKEERAKEERAKEERKEERAPDEADALWNHAEEHALLQAEDAETERHFAEMEKELEAEPLAESAAEKAFEARERERERERAQWEREQDDARERARAEAAAHALEADAAPEEVPVRIRRKINWGKPTALTLFLILLFGLFVVPFIPFDGYIPQFEKLAGAHLQEPVKIKSLHLMLLPQPHWRMDDVSVGNEGQLKVSRVNAFTELGSLLSKHKVFTSIELESPVLSEKGLLALLFGKPPGPDFARASISATNAKLDSKTFSLPALDAKLALGEKGVWRDITLETPDHNTRLRLTEDPEGANIEAHTNKFSMPLKPSFVLENFDAKGVIRRGELRLSEFNGEIYGGYLSGTASLKWGTDWSLSGVIKARAMNPAKLAPNLVEGGTLEGKLVYAMQGKSYAALFAAPHVEGSFVVSRGALLGVDMGRFLQSGEAGGKTAFTALSGTFVRDAGKTELRRLLLAAGPLSARGGADTDAADHISGRFAVELKSSVAQARANLSLSGALGDPHFGR